MEEQAEILRGLLEDLDVEDAEEQEEPNGIAAQFSRLRSQSTKYRTDKTLPTKTAEKSDNFKKNRYKDILPFDHSRVKLTFTTSKNDTDYINASFIKGVTGSRAYIATQGPLPHTVLDFLRMLWEYNIEVVVMACREFEMGKKKCECYWPKNHDEPFVCEPFTIYCDSEENKGDYVTRTLRVNYRDGSRTMKQLHYVNWPDHGVPDSIPPILDLLLEMRSYQEHDDTPICIHCSAGCGRTGALCVIDYTWNLLKKQMITSDFSIYNMVQNMRTQRPSVVQTKEQYVLVHRTIKLLFEKFLDEVDALKQSAEIATDETVLPSTVPAEMGSVIFDLDEKWNDLDQLQHMLEINHSPTLENAYQIETENTQPWQISEDLQVTSFFTDIPKSTSPHELTPPTEPDPDREAQERTQDSEDQQGLSCDATLHLMVEDPYFNSPTEEQAPNSWSNNGTPSLSLNDQPLEVFTFDSNSGTLNVHSDDEAPPPLPERTPESYEIPENTESDMRLAVVIPPNAAAAAVRELRGSSGSPPSPVPPLPERTPESFELATEPAPTVERPQPAAPINLNLLGVSSEWSGSSDVGVNHYETKPWTRSKSLRAKMTFSEFSQSKKTINNNSKPSKHQRPDLPPPPPPPGPPVYPLPAAPQPLSQDNTSGISASGSQPTAHGVSMSSESEAPTQSKKFLDVVMNRSKSVRVKGSSREPLTVSRPQTPPPDAFGATAPENTVAGHNGDSKASTEAPDKSLSRSKSLKFFRSKQKSKAEPPRSQPSTPPPSYESLSSIFKFGFGTRFGKPKGPRSYPVTWV